MPQQTGTATPNPPTMTRLHQTSETFAPIMEMTINATRPMAMQAVA